MSIMSPNVEHRKHDAQRANKAKNSPAVCRERILRRWAPDQVSPLDLSAQLVFVVATLEVTQGQILSQSPTDATRFWWHLYGS